MINIDDRLLEEVSSDELWLLLQIVKRFNERLICWPSNKTLCTDTGWSLKKMQKIKGNLVEKGILLTKVRYFDKSQSSNEYMINTDFMGVYVPAKRIPLGMQSEGEGDESILPTPPESKKGGTPESKLPYKVLTTEVLTIEPSEANASGELFSAIGKKEKGTKEVDPNYKPFVKAWCERYPILGFNATSGKKIKELIADTRAVLIERKLVPTDAKMIESFQYVLDYVRDSNHFIHGKVITTFQQQYRSVMNEITNGGKKQQRSGVDSAGKQILEQVYGITTAR